MPSLDGFLDIYYRRMAVLRTEEDFYDLISAYLKRAATESVRHAEIFFDPSARTSRGIDIAQVCGGISQALHDGEERLGITSRLIMCFLRHLDEDDALNTLEKAMPFRNEIFGVGLDSAKAGNPPGKFRKVFAKARDAGFAPVAQAGKEGPASYVREAVEAIRVQRIDHGCRVLEDPALTEELVRRAIRLTVCPLSNVKLCVADTMERHPLKKMLDAGLMVTINSDGPAFWGGDTSAKITKRCRTDWVLDDRILGELARNSFMASFIDDEKKEEEERRRWMPTWQEVSRGGGDSEETAGPRSPVTWEPRRPIAGIQEATAGRKAPLLASTKT